MRGRRLQDFAHRRETGCDDVFRAMVVGKGGSLEIGLRELRKEHGVPRSGGVRRRRFLHRLGLRPAGRGQFLGRRPHQPPQTLAAYGNASGSGRPRAVCGLSCPCDVVNRQALDLEVCRGGFDERPVVMGHTAVARSLLGETPWLLVIPDVPKLPEALPLGCLPVASKSQGSSSSGCPRCLSSSSLCIR